MCHSEGNGDTAVEYITTATRELQECGGMVGCLGQQHVASLLLLTPAVGVCVYSRITHWPERWEYWGRINTDIVSVRLQKYSRFIVAAGTSLRRLTFCCRHSGYRWQTGSRRVAGWLRIKTINPCLFFIASLGVRNLRPIADQHDVFPEMISGFAGFSNICRKILSLCDCLWTSHHLPGACLSVRLSAIAAANTSKTSVAEDHTSVG